MSRPAKRRFAKVSRARVLIPRLSESELYRFVKKRKMDTELELFEHPETMVEVGKKLLSFKQDDSDVHFLVGPERERIGAHKFILKARSPLVERMFCSSRWSKSGSAACNTGQVQPIVLKVHEPLTFRSFLEYVYTDQFSASAIDAVKLLHLARFFDVQPLVKLCNKVLEKPFQLNEVFQIFLAARKYGNSDLSKGALAFMARNVIPLGNSGDFDSVDEATLIILLKRSDLCVGEAQLFTMLLRWADKQIQNSGQEPKPERKDILRKLIPLVRFPTMTPKEFASAVATTNLLPHKTINSLFVYLNSDGADMIDRGREVPYSKAPRRGIPTRIELYKTSSRPGRRIFPFTKLLRLSSCAGLQETLTFRFSGRITEKKPSIKIVSLVLQGPRYGEGAFANSSEAKKILPFLQVKISVSRYTRVDKEVIPVKVAEVTANVGQGETEVLLDKPVVVSGIENYDITLEFLSDVYTLPLVMDCGDGRGRMERDMGVDFFTSTALPLDIAQNCASFGTMGISDISMSSGGMRSAGPLSDIAGGKGYCLVNGFSHRTAMSTGLHLLRALNFAHV